MLAFVDNEFYLFYTHICTYTYIHTCSLYFKMSNINKIFQRYLVECCHFINLNLVILSSRKLKYLIICAFYCSMYDHQYLEI